MQRHNEVRVLACGALAEGDGRRQGWRELSVRGTRDSSIFIHGLQRLIPLVLCPVCYCP